MIEKYQKIVEEKKEENKTSKKGIFIFLLIILILGGISYFIYTNYDISINPGGSREFKRLLEITSIDYYKNNHLLLRRNNDMDIDLEGDNLGDKMIIYNMYTKSDDMKNVRISECVDGKETYRWISYDDMDYIRYYGDDNYMPMINLTYSMQNNYDYMPDLTIFENYNPILLYNNTPIGEGMSGHEEIYRMRIKNDEVYTNILSSIIPERYVDTYTYLRIYLNEMNLVTKISISESEYGANIYGPYEFEYYYDKSYDIDDFYKFLEDRRGSRTHRVQLKGMLDKKDYGIISIHEGERLYIEDGDKYNIYDSEGILYDYKEDLIEEDTVLYVKEK